MKYYLVFLIAFVFLGCKKENLMTLPSTDDLPIEDESFMKVLWKTPLRQDFSYCKSLNPLLTS